MTIEWDSNNPAGDISIVKLSLNIDEKEYRSFISQSSKMLNSASFFQNQFVDSQQDFTELAEARLELPKLDVKPLGTVGQPYRRGEEVVFYWNVTSILGGDFKGSIWVYVANKSIARDLASRYPIAVQPIELHWRDLFGLSGKSARYAGVIGLIIGILLIIIIQLNSKKLHR